MTFDRSSGRQLRLSVLFTRFLPLLCVLFGACATTTRVPTSGGEPSLIAMVNSTGIPSVKSRIDAVLVDSLFPPSNIAVKVVSVEKGEIWYDLNSDLLFHPASNQKLFTAAAALAILGPDYTVNTIVRLDTARRTIEVKGSGDPLLTGSELDSIASVILPLLKGSGPWIILGDTSSFDDREWGAGWAWDDEPDRTAMFISPLSVNENCIRVQVRPGRRAGDPLQVSTQPATAFVTIENRGRTTADTIVEPLKVSRRWRERSNILTIEGEMRITDSSTMRTVSVRQPERYTLTLLKESLERRGVAIGGIILDRSRPEGWEVFRLSRRLDSIVTYMNKVSDNLAAECVLKILGAERNIAPGSASGGLAAVNEFLGRAGIDTLRLQLADGSGVSRYNLASAGAITQLLTAVARDQRLFPPFHHSLALAGDDGNLSDRMKRTPAQGNLRGKTGTLTAVSSLSGFVRSADGELLAFSVLMQFFPGGVRPYRFVQDRIGAILAGTERDRP